jgi:hypothetical protein
MYICLVSVGGFSMKLNLSQYFSLYIDLVDLIIGHDTFGFIFLAPTGTLLNANDNQLFDNGSGAQVISDSTVRSSNNARYGRGPVGVEVLQQEVRDKMRSLLRTRNLTGCPLNIPFKDVEDVIANVSF